MRDTQSELRDGRVKSDSRPCSLWAQSQLRRQSPPCLRTVLALGSTTCCLFLFFFARPNLFLPYLSHLTKCSMTSGRRGGGPSSWSHHHLFPQSTTQSEIQLIFRTYHTHTNDPFLISSILTKTLRIEIWQFIYALYWNYFTSTRGAPCAKSSHNYDLQCMV